MMSQQAREMCAPHINPNQVLRAYAPNSPRAKARLIVLAMLADGNLDDIELETLSRRGMFAKLGIAREDFFQVFFDFCADVESLPNGEGDYLLQPIVLKQLFGEIDDAAERQSLLFHISDMIHSDGRLEEGEVVLLRQAVATWKLRAADSLTVIRRQ